MKSTLDPLLVAAGALAGAARRVVGGDDLNGFPVAPATLEGVGPLISALRKALDEYDRLVVAREMADKPTKAPT